MKIEKIRLFVILVSTVLTLNSCLKNDVKDLISSDEAESTLSYMGFEFLLIDEFEINLEYFDNLNQPVDGVYVEFYSENPLDEYGLLTAEAKTKKILSGISNENGNFSGLANVPSYTDSIYVLTKHIGFPLLTKVELTSDKINLEIGKKQTNSLKSSTETKFMTIPDVNLVNGYYVLGTWTSNGVPDYLESTGDVIDADFLDDVNASLPEYERLPDSHPQYLASDDDASLVIIEDCEAWVTFVHEGAGWYNSLGYYTYPTNNPPANAEDINNMTIIYPNLSKFADGLDTGDKVQLFYLDPETEQFTNIFPAGTSVGWFLIARGWSGGTISDGIYKHYSNVSFNVESDPDLQKHNVLLYDSERELLLMGFEDIRRDSRCDEDFNDAVFYSTVNPVTAVDNSKYQPIDDPVDTDDDGTSDVFDQFINDPAKAFNNYYPAEGQTGTLVFEDLWPYKGDYDFNDLVVDYNFNQITNADNEVTGIYSKIVVRAIGASYHNAFGISLNTTPGNIASVTGQLNTEGYLDIASNGAENGQSNAVIMIFDDAYNVLPYPGTGICVNTYPEYEYVTPDTLYVNIEFANPVPFTTLGTPPYNPFIVIDRNRGVEVHLPNSAPTDLADLSLLGAGDDDSNINTNEYYVSDIYLPWAINIPVRFDYVSEKEDITQTHLMFNPWAVSRGYNYMDWYMSKTGYRNTSKIYNR